MDGYEKYQKLMADWAGDYMRPFVDSKKQGQMPESSKVFLTKLFYGFTEISGAYEALRLSEILISIAPPRSKRISHDDYLKYHINSYLQEVYILKERLNSYLTKLQRVYAKTSQSKRFQEQVAPLLDLVKTAFEGIISTRGRHVHAYRYTDEDLNRLSSLTFISRFKNDFVDEAKFEYKWVKRIWSDRVKENNEATLRLLNLFFERMYGAVTDNGKVVVPNDAFH